jgi:hypothetical protein
MTEFTFEKVTLNNQLGYIATRRIAGVFTGTAFGKTKKAAVAAFDEVDIPKELT